MKMVHTCIVKGCKSEWSPGCNLTFHRFPASVIRRNDWLTRVPIKSKFYNSAKICSLHFKTEDYDYTGNKLKQTATPHFCENDVNNKDKLHFDTVFIVDDKEMPSSSIRVDDQPLSEIDKKENESPLLKRLLEISPIQKCTESIVTPTNKATTTSHRCVQANLKSTREKMLARSNKLLKQIVNRQNTRIDKIRDKLKLKSRREKMLIKSYKLLKRKVKRQISCINHLNALLAAVKQTRMSQGYL